VRRRRTSAGSGAGRRVGGAPRREPTGAVAAGRTAVQATAPGARPAECPAADDAARRSVTKHAHFVTWYGAHATP
jgi:hypothetical protein